MTTDLDYSSSSTPATRSEEDYAAVCSSLFDYIAGAEKNAFANLLPRHDVEIGESVNEIWPVTFPGSNNPYPFVLVGVIMPSPQTKLSSTGNLFNFDRVSTVVRRYG